MKNIIITTICVVLSYGMSYAQQPAVTAPSAAAFNYTQYSSSRTNYIDGSESIEVPIASVSEGPLSHGVSISYNTKGIKTNTVASQVGLGWHLNAGGMITRSIQGISDDNSNGYGYWEMNDNSYSGSDQLYVEGDRDLQPDIYHYNVGGFSGSFTLDENNNFHNIPVSNRKIEVEWDGVNGNSYDFGFVRFIITDEMGTKYYFGVDDNNNDYLEFTAVKSPSEYMLTKCCNDRDDITGWFLYKIESFDQKHSINFEYSPSDYHYLSLATQAKFKYKELNGNVMGESDHLYQGNHPSFDDVFNDVTTVSWVVSKISCSNVEIDFINRDLSQGSQYAREDVFYRKKYVCCDGNSFITDYPSYLESINVNYLGTTKCVKFELNQSYFEDLTTNNHGWPYYNANKKRLKLDGIQKMSCDNSLSEPATTFEYYGNNFFPTYLTTGVDEWGYYNAKNTNSYKLIPSASYTYQGETFHYGTADRSSHINETKTGVLKKVTYPTGGHIEYDYELNSTSESTTNSLFFDIYPCSSNSPNYCCNTQNPSNTPTVYITPEIKNNSTFELFLDPAPHSPSGSNGCNWVNSNIKVKVKEQPSNAQVGVVEINQWPSQGYPSTLNVSLNNLTFIQEGISYKFEIESNNVKNTTYAKMTNPNSSITSPIGGLRIKSKKIHDGYDTNKDIITTYDYSDFGLTSSSGVLHQANFKYVVPVHDVDYAQVYFYSEPFFGFTNYFGSHINYKNVTILNNGEGKTEMEFSTINPGNNSNYYPPAPAAYNSEVGFHKMSKVYDQAGNTLSMVENIKKYAVDQNIVTTNAYRYVPTFDGTNIIYDDKIRVNTYDVKTGIQRTEQSKTTTDGLESTINYIYPGGGVSFLPSETSTTNSDGVVHKTVHDYTTNYWWGSTDPSSPNFNNCLKLEFEDKNIRNVNWYNVKYADSEVVDGNATEYRLFNDSGVQTSCGSSNPNKYLRPWKVHRLERSWDQNGSIYPGSSTWWELKKTFQQYRSNGLIFRILKPNSHFQEFTYSNKRLIQSKYLNQVKTYAYYGDSPLLQSITDIHGLSTSYEYDDLTRLSKTTNDCNGVFTENFYQFTSGSSTYPDNKIWSITDYNPACSGGPCNPANTFSLVDKIESTVYLDGLGRTVQSVLNEHEPGVDKTGDIINHIEYDNHGRAYKKYLPFLVTNNNGAYVSSIPANLEYSETTYEQSPLSRVLNENPPGTLDGSDNYYETNTYAENVIDHRNGGVFFQGGTLKKTRTVDANNIESILYTDKIGRKILSRSKAVTASTYDTEMYYIYDDKNRIKEVIPDGSSITTDNLNYHYLYYPNDQIKSKKIPDGGETKYIYDNRKRLYLMQDANLSNNNEWIISKYDNYGREIQSGIKLITSPPANQSAPNLTLSSNDINTTSSYDQTTHNLDVSSTRILGTNDFLTSTYTYDACNRIATSSSNSHLDLSNNQSYVTEYTYNQMSDILELKQTLDINGTTNSLYERFWYDNEGRDDKYQVNIDGVGYQSVSYSKFNEREELIQQKLGRSGSSWLQHIDYSYTDWGALKAINSPTTMVGSEVELETGTVTFSNQASIDNRDLFYSELYYDEVLDLDNNSTNDSQSYLNGNISAVKWQTRGRREMAYTYNYDNEYKLTSADFYEQNTANEHFTKTELFSTDYTYSDRGRITNINRNNVNDISFIDWRDPGTPWYVPCTSSVSLSYLPSSNKINQRTEQACGLFLQSFDKTYTYDDNGNVTDNPDLKNIQYNHLNLIESYDEGGQNSYAATYTASGSKVKMDNFDNIGPFEFKSGTLNKIYFSDGYQDDSGEFNYYIKDHLGNTRIVFKDENNDNKINDVTDLTKEIHYFPFGMKMNGPWVDRNYTNDPDYEYNSIEFKTNNIQEGRVGHGAQKNRGLNHATYRSLDPTIGMWLQVDPKAEVLKGITPYNSMANNPVSFNDPDGDIIPALLIGAAVGLATNGIGNVAAGNNFFQGAGQAAAFGALGGGISSAIGGAAASMSGLGKAAFQMGAHGLSGGAMSAAQGGSFGSGALSGALSSGLSSGASELGVGNAAMIGVGGLGGGIGSSISGGNFWMGARQGLITSGLNHAAHSGAFGSNVAAALATGQARHFLGPDALGGALEFGGAGGIGANVEVGGIRMMRGSQKGITKTYLDLGIGAGVDVNAGLTGTKYYYSGGLKHLTFSNAFSGISHQLAISGGALGLDFSGNVSRSNRNALGHRTYSFGVGIGLSPAPVMFGGSYFRNETFLDPFATFGSYP